MFRISQTFRHESGYCLTPIEMDGVGFVFLPREFEGQAGYENLSDMMRQSESFVEGIDYLVLKDSNLLEFKELLNRRNTVPSVDDLKHARALIVPTESGMNILLSLSRKPEMAGFRKWAVSEVFPFMRPASIVPAETFRFAGTFTHGEGFRVTPIEMQGVGFVFLPQELEEALGYDDLSKLVLQSDSFAEGVEYVVLRNSKLNEFKELLMSVHSMDPVRDLKHAPSLIVLTETGLYTVALLSRKPNAVVFRRWVTGELLPSVRRTGKYEMAGTVPGSESLPELPGRMRSLEQSFSRMLARQEEFQQRMLRRLDGIEAALADSRQDEFQRHVLRRLDGIEAALADLRQGEFQQYMLRGLDRIDAVLSDSLPHDMFAGYEKIRRLVDDMTAMYGLSQAERRRYTRELCRTHGVPLPEKALLEGGSPFRDLRELAARAGLSSPNGRPHSRLAAALIRHLGLDRGEYVRKTGAANPRYSEDVIPHMLQWLRDQGWPETVGVPGPEGGRMRSFRVQYRSTARV